MRSVLTVLAVLAVVLLCCTLGSDLGAAETAAKKPAPARAAKPAAAEKPAAPDPTPRLWTSNVIAPDTAAAPAGDKPGPITLVGARNGAFSGRVMVSAAGPIKGLRATASALTMAEAEIPVKNLTVRYALKWDESWRSNSSKELDVLLETPPAEVPAGNGTALAAVWVTVNVPRDAKPGLYKGTLKVEAAGLPAESVAVELKLMDWTVPDSQNFTCWVDMIQSPDSLAIEYKVPLWSEAHWKLIAASFDRMKDLGCRNVYIPLLARTNFGNEESMVRWVKKGESGYSYDFTNMDKYIDMAARHLGKLKMVTFQVWEVYLAENNTKSISFKNTEAAKEGRKELAGKGPRVTVLDPQTGRTEMVYLPAYDDPSSKALWQPLFAELRKLLADRELEKTMMLGMVSDVWPPKEDVAFLHEVSGGLAWVSHAHPGHLRGKPVVGNKLLSKIADLGYEAHVYDLDYQVNPAKGRQYGWNKPVLEVRFARNGWPNYASMLDMHQLMEFNITGGQRGLGRLGADVWYVIRNQRNQRAGAVYHRYPEVCWRNLDIESWVLAPAAAGPVATGRLENLREGIQESEARIVIERALIDPTLKSRLGDSLARECQEMLDARQWALWRSIWTDETDLKNLGAIQDREPIEAIWGALAKTTKKLPGYWDAAARKMRTDEGVKGREWFVASPWQARNERLFALAGEVEKKCGPPEAKAK